MFQYRFARNTECFSQGRSCFSQPDQSNAELLLELMLRYFPSMSFKIHYFLISCSGFRRKFYLLLSGDRTKNYVRGRKNPAVTETHVTWISGKKTKRNLAHFVNNSSLCSGNSSPTFRDNVFGPIVKDFLALDDGTETLSRNVYKELPLYAA